MTLDRRAAQALLLVDETCSRIARLVARGRVAFDQDEALFDACQLGIVRLNTDLDRLGREWVAAHPDIPRDGVRGFRNRGHDYHSVDADILWIVVSTSVPELQRMLGPQITEARGVLTR